MHNIVVGCTFGDEGKGQVTHALCCDAKRNHLNPIVVRFSGGVILLLLNQGKLIYFLVLALVHL